MAWRGEEDADAIWGDEDLQVDERGSTKKLPLPRDHIVFLVDGRAAMHHAAGGEPSPFLCVLRAAEACMRSKVLRSGRDQVGVIVFGLAPAEPDEPNDDGAISEETRKQLRSGIRTLLPLDVPGKESILEARRLGRKAVNLEAELNVDPRSAKEPLDLSAALGAAHAALDAGDGVKRHDDRRIWIFSNDDNPTRGAPDLRTRTLHVADDIAANGIVFELWPLAPGGERSFDVEAFYAALLQPDPEAAGVPLRGAPGGALGEAGGDPASRQATRLQERLYVGAETASLEDLLAATRRRIVRQRRLGTMHLYLGSPSVARELEALRKRGAAADDIARRLYRPAKDEICATVSLFNATAPQKKPQAVKLDARDNKPVRTVSTYVDDDTGATLTSGAWRTYFPLGGEKVYVTSHELARLRTDPDPLPTGGGSRRGSQSSQSHGSPPLVPLVAPQASQGSHGAESLVVGSQAGGSASTPLEAEQPKELKPMGEPLLRLLGFISADELPFVPSVRSSWWVRPEESRIRGSTALLLALHHAMLEKGRLGVLAARRSRLSEIRLALLVPQAEGAASDGDTLRRRGGEVERLLPVSSAPGFHLVVLPFLEDVRRTPIGKTQPVIPEEVGLPSTLAAAAAMRRTEAGEAPEGRNVDDAAHGGAAMPLFDAAVDLVRSTRLENFAFEQYPNPLLAKYYAMLESIALDDSDEEDKLAFDEDAEPTKPRDAFFAQPAVRDAIARFADCTGALPEEEEKPATARKRAAAAKVKDEAPGSGKKEKKPRKAAAKPKPKANPKAKARAKPKAKMKAKAKAQAEPEDVAEEDVSQRKRRRVVQKEEDDDF